MLLHSHKDVAASEVVEVVGKCTDTIVDISGVPAFLEFNYVVLDFPLIQQLFLLIGSAIYL